MKRAAFTLMWAVPAACGAVQVLIWRAYKLHGPALKNMKDRLREWEMSLSNDRHNTEKLALA